MPRHPRPSDAPPSHPDILPFFQPIVDLRQGTIFGHEALVRGPASTALHNPEALLAQAASESRLTEFELHCVEIVLTAWSRLDDPGRLFVNLSPDALTAAMGGVGSACWLERMLARCDIAARDITVELTEQRARKSVV